MAARKMKKASGGARKASARPRKSGARGRKSAARKSPRTAHKAPVARKAIRRAASKHTARARGSEEYLGYSGKFTVRLPKSLHKALVDRAEKEGVSLNLFVTNALSRTVATPRGGR